MDKILTWLLDQYVDCWPIITRTIRFYCYTSANKW